MDHDSFKLGQKKLKLDILISLLFEIIQIVLLLKGNHVYNRFPGQVCSGGYDMVMGADYMVESGNMMYLLLMIFWIWTSIKLCCNFCGIWTIFIASNGKDFVKNKI